MLFNSVGFAIFFPVVVIIYFLIEQNISSLRALRAGNLWLLAASYFYYMCQGPVYALLLFSVTLITYICGSIAGNRLHTLSVRRAALAAGTAAALSMLFFFKYFSFACRIIGADPALKIILPVGISFYIFQSLTYIFDAYKGDTEPEHDFLKYALFVSFFPVLLAGPIERSKNLLRQFDDLHSFDYTRTRHGLIRIMYGLFLKIVIAQRLSIAVDLIYDNYSDCTGYQLLLGTVLYAFQIYCDFDSYSSIATGCAEIMGFRLTENFRQPFFAVSCADLWRRWHVSLNSWFRDYLYIPLGGGRVPKWRKYLNIMIVFTTSGLWHGADWTYIIWGALSGLFQVLGEILKPFRIAVLKRLPLHSTFTHKCHHILQILITFGLFSTSLIFFRSGDLNAALTITGKIFTRFSFASILTTSPFSLGLGVKNLLFLLFSLAILFIYDLINEKTGDAAALIASESTPVRWCVYYIFTLMIIASASLGTQQFIYFKF